VTPRPYQRDRRHLERLLPLLAVQMQEQGGPKVVRHQRPIGVLAQPADDVEVLCR